MQSLREQLFEEFSKVFRSEHSGKLLHMLSQGGYCLEIALEQDLGQGADPIAFVFDTRLLRSRLELAVARKNKRAIPKLNPREIAGDLANIAQRLLAMYETRQLTAIDRLLLSTMKLQQEMATQDETGGAGTWLVSFTVYGVSLMGIYCEQYSSDRYGTGLDDVITEPADVQSNLPSEAPFLRIPEQKWYNDLDPEAQFQVRFGTSLADKVYLNSELKEVEDFSPLLLSFVKAVEVEIRQHFQTYSGSLIPLSQQISGYLDKHSDGNGSGRDADYKLREYLKPLAQEIAKKGMNFNPKGSGIKEIYLLFKYYALRIGLEQRLNFHSYLPSAKVGIIGRHESDLKWIVDLNRARNGFIHRDIINDEGVFLRHYDGLFRLLSLLVQLKK